MGVTSEGSEPKPGEHVVISKPAYVYEQNTTTLSGKAITMTKQTFYSYEPDVNGASSTGTDPQVKLLRSRPQKTVPRFWVN